MREVRRPDPPRRLTAEIGRIPDPQDREYPFVPSRKPVLLTINALKHVKKAVIPCKDSATRYQTGRFALRAERWEWGALSRA
jgi:hypothetical protein